MKTKLLIFLLVLVIGALIVAAVQFRAVNAELLREADRFNVPVLDKALFALSDWDYQTLKPHLSKKFLKSFTEEEFQKELDEMSILGKVESIRIRRHVNHSKYKHWLYGECAVNKYSVSTNFAKGRGVVIMNLNHCYKKAEVTFLQVYSKVLPVKSPALQ
jgi:hypothetical protein